jgi:TPR repeat protein
MNDILNGKDKRSFTRRIKEARIGDAAAQYDVALMYATGLGVAKNVSQAFAWTKSAAEKGHVAAQYLLGSAYAGGLGTTKDERNALLWFVKAYEHGNEKASLKLARLFSTSQPTIAFRFALDSAEKGIAEAQLAVADTYMSAIGVPKDTRLALAWYQLAAEQGLPAAHYALGQAHEQGIGVVVDMVLACQWYREAAGRGHPGAQLVLDRLDTAGQRWMRKSAKGRTGARERRTVDNRWDVYAAHGHPEDIYHVGLMYELGVKVEKSAKQAKHWYKKAAELGHAQAQFAFARSVETSEHVQAAIWYEKAAEQGHADAQYALADLQFHGLGVARDALSALTWYAKAATGGNCQALYAIGKLLKSDVDDLAYAAIERAAVGGQPDAQCAMGDRCRQGNGVEQNWFEACRWYQMAAERDNAAAQCELAACYAEGKGVRKDRVQAFAWFEKAAAQNVPQAQWNLGEMYATGLPGIDPNPKKAAMLCKRAANAGFAPASATLAALFAKANKHERAVHWWTLAANQGDLEALFNLGQAYRLGLGVAKDEAKAFECLLKAAQGGVAVAQSRIGLFYATGEGAALDAIEAAKWFKLAAMHGDKAAAANFDRASQTLGVAQLAEANRRAQEWLRFAENRV